MVLVFIFSFFSTPFLGGFERNVFVPSVVASFFVVTVLFIYARLRNASLCGKSLVTLCCCDGKEVIMLYFCVSGFVQFQFM